MSVATITFRDRVPGPHSLFVGMDGEHNAETLRFVGLPELDDAQMTLLNLVIGDTVDVIDIIDGEVTLTRNHTIPGTIIGWVTIQVGDTLVWKSEKIYMSINDLPDISDPIEQQYPTAFEQIIAQTGENVTAAQAAQAAAETAQGKAEDAQDAAEDARDDAVDAKGDAIDAKTAAETAQGKAETAQSKAEEAQSYAESARDAAQRASVESGQARDQAVSAKDLVLGMSAQATTLQPGSDATASYSNGMLTLGIPRGADGQDADLAIHICTAGEYDPDTGVPTVQNPDLNKFYLVPGGDAPNLYVEWIYTNGAWEQFGSASIDLSDYAKKEDVPDVATVAETQSIIDMYGEDEDMLFETTYVANSGTPHFATVDDADDIAAAFKAGKGVTVKLPTGEGPASYAILNDIYTRMIAYEEPTETKAANFYFTPRDYCVYDSRNTASQSYNFIYGTEVGQDGKLHFMIYVD